MRIKSENRKNAQDSQFSIHFHSFIRFHFQRFIYSIVNFSLLFLNCKRSLYFKLNIFNKLIIH